MQLLRQGPRPVLSALLLLALAAPARDLAAAPVRGQDGRVVAAPADLSPAPEALEVSHGLVWLVLADGTPAKSATRVPAGMYVTAAGVANLDVSFGREAAALRAERDRLRDELARARAPLPGVPVAPPAVGEARRWPTAVLVGGLVLGLVAGGYVGCRVGGGCR